MEIGTGVAVAGSAFAIAAIVIKWISAISPNERRIESDPPCLAHSAIAQQLETFEKWMGKIEKKLDDALVLVYKGER